MKIFIMAGALVFLSILGWSQSNLEGYLVDNLCGKAGYPEGYQGKIDLTMTPEKNSVACLVMENCKATGFGLFIKGTGGKYVFHPFDAASNQRVTREILPKLTRMNDPSPLLKVAGRVTPQGTIVSLTKVELMQDQKVRPAPAPSMSGHSM